jgi:outer membrane protein TolC
VNLPIFSGGRIRADNEQAEAALAQRRAELQDEMGQVELDVRNAFLDLQVATGQIALAAENRTLALETLRQSQDRFAAGAGTSVEVVQSQQTLGAANHDYVNALFAENLARISLARAMGQAEQSLPTFLSGK